jgi:hypothetical protein
MVKRYALIASKGSRWDNEEVVAKYLPDNYVVDGVTSLGIVVSGRDKAGWTLDAYVLPRLASGLIFGTEIDLSHPALKEIPVINEAFRRETAATQQMVADMERDGLL